MTPPPALAKTSREAAQVVFAPTKEEVKEEVHAAVSMALELERERIRSEVTAEMAGAAAQSTSVKVTAKMAGAAQSKSAVTDSIAEHASEQPVIEAPPPDATINKTTVIESVAREPTFQVRGKVEVFVCCFSI